MADSIEDLEFVDGRTGGTPVNAENLNLIAAELRAHKAALGSVASGAQFAPTYTGTAEQIEPLIAALEPGIEYLWNETDGSGQLVDIKSGVA